MQVCVTLTRNGGVGPVVRVFCDAEAASRHLEQVAAEWGIAPEAEHVDAGHDPITGRVVWFATETAECRIEGPLLVEG